MTVPSPPPDLVCDPRPLPADTVVHRIHSNSFAANSFNPGRGFSRFAPFTAASGRPVSTIYAATSFAAAAFETIFHDIDPAAAFKSVSMEKIKDLNYAQLAPTRLLCLAGLFAPALGKWNCTRTQLIDTPPSTYNETRRWTPVIHASNSKLDGMIWTSRRNDEDKALLLFGDRVDPAELRPVLSEPIATSPRWLDELARLADAAGITLTM